MDFVQKWKSDQFVIAIVHCVIFSRSPLPTRKSRPAEVRTNLSHLHSSPVLRFVKPLTKVHKEELRNWHWSPGRMFTPATLQDYLSRSNYDDEIYEALAQDDTSEVVMKVMGIQKKMNNFDLPKLHTFESKSNVSSTAKRYEGNNAYRAGLYQRALALYNEALLCAPNGSREMILAYSNRSALFHKLKAWNACYNDINKVFAMGCPRDIEEKLNKRQNDAIPHLSKENFSKNLMIQEAERLIDCNSMTRHTEIPCASSDIKIVTTTGMPKVVAAAYTFVGAVLASEQAYVSHTDIRTSNFSCHYCQKKKLNLIPCEGCCYALFCDEECKNKCIKEYHEYECNILGIIKDLGPKLNLMIKQCLKLQKACKSWDEFIAASYNMGSSRIKASSIQEIFDTNNKYSVLCCKDDKTFVYGELYNGAFNAAFLLYYLEDQIPSFFPKDMDKKNQAMRALARVMMFLSVYQKPLIIMQGQKNIQLDTSGYGTENYGVFPFISKLKNSCNANSTLAVNNNKLVLIALCPIKNGEEITIPFLIYKHLEKMDDKKQLNLKTFMLHGTVCGCHRCSDSSSEINHDGEKLSKYQRKYFGKLDLGVIASRLSHFEINDVYPTLVRALTVLHDVPNTKEYIAVYMLWRQCVHFFEVACSDNQVLDNTI